MYVLVDLDHSKHLIFKKTSTFVICNTMHTYADHPRVLLLSISDQGKDVTLCNEFETVPRCASFGNQLSLTRSYLPLHSFPDSRPSTSSVLDSHLQPPADARPRKRRTRNPQHRVRVRRPAGISSSQAIQRERVPIDQVPASCSDNKQRCPLLQVPHSSGASSSGVHLKLKK